MSSTGVRDQEAELRNRVRTGAATKKHTGRKKPDWTPPHAADLADGFLLCFDQAVAHTGWAVLERHAEKGLMLHDRGQIKQPAVPELKGWADTLQRATWLALELEPVVLSWRAHVAGDELVQIVYEMPSVHGMRVDSALLGGLAVTTLAARYNIPCHGVETVHAKLVLTGNRSSEKKDMKQAVLRYVENPGTPFNEHIVDAIGLGLTYLHDLKAAA